MVRVIIILIFVIVGYIFITKLSSNASAKRKQQFESYVQNDDYVPEVEANYVVKDSVEDKIRQLVSLKNDNIISEEEFEAKKKELISRM